MRLDCIPNSRDAGSCPAVRDLARVSQCQNSVRALGQQTASAQFIHRVLSASERLKLVQQLRLGQRGYWTLARAPAIPAW